ncbi:hypothetical protein CALCODRAFT_58627 [Calocera cornea HHB12733]|uniref:Uncharacterized protein n=1 Tax=Calocera cornea HHB12733 TaxID=1353952 RepID=A0A165IVX5_9BASI|nr:hypothetical protein CALCODRAFT_58627 [Calocera cornea HHB12733]
MLHPPYWTSRVHLRLRASLPLLDKSASEGCPPTLLAHSMYQAELYLAGSTRGQLYPGRLPYTSYTSYSSYSSYALDPIIKPAILPPCSADLQSTYGTPAGSGSGSGSGGSWLENGAGDWDLEVPLAPCDRPVFTEWPPTVGRPGAGPVHLNGPSLQLIQSIRAWVPQAASSSGVGCRPTNACQMTRPGPGPGLGLGEAGASGQPAG